MVYSHDLEYTNDNTDSRDYDDYDIDAPVQEIQANAQNRMLRPKSQARPRKDQPQRTRMPFNRWSKLSTEEREIWDKLDEAANATILGTPKTGSLPSGSTGSTRRVNLHEISAYDFIQANMHP